MRKIANDLNTFQILLEPYFADYEEVICSYNFNIFKLFLFLL